MKLISMLLFGWILQTGTPVWLTDFAQAKTEAKQAHKYLLVNFSGSDWCLPCIRMHKVLFDTPVFDSFATKELVLVQADFPRLKKHQLSKQQQQHNDSLAEQYNPAGKFPYTVLLDAEGKMIRSWDGMPDVTADKFVGDIKSTIHGSH